jgi:hypothetical protein
MLRVGFIGLVLIATPAPAQNEIRISASDLASLCEGGMSRMATCASFFRGFYAAAKGQQALSPESAVVCIPDQASVIEMIAVFQNYLIANPEQNNQSAEIVAFMAMRDRYAC